MMFCERDKEIKMAKLFEQATENLLHAVSCVGQAKKKAEEAMIYVRHTEEIARKITKPKWRKEMEDDVLTEDIIRKALRGIDFPPSNEPCIVLHPQIWDDYKNVFNLTEEQMAKWFVKSTYIE